MQAVKGVRAGLVVPVQPSDLIRQTSLFDMGAAVGDGGYGECIMKPWARYAIGIIAGIGVGAGGAWALGNRGFMGGSIESGPWRTSLGYATADTDLLTRAQVARGGLLALPSQEVIYWQAKTDSAGNPLDGNCNYWVRGGPVDARWWSISYYDESGYLLANPANIWSFSGAQLLPGEGENWRFLISPTKSEQGHWLPGVPGQGFDLTLRLYNPGSGLREAPEAASLPIIERESCA